ncbi:MAG TPA: hypothetical protein VHN16_16995, partial [Streptosporangiaceae bacterium]|nr:hypothetical protein [Streptosporangiaceae bacterium]
MIRFSAFLVVVAVGLLVAGVVTSKLLLVYLAIGVSGVALLALGVGAAVKWRELFGKPQAAAAEAGVREPVSGSAPQALASQAQLDHQGYPRPATAPRGPARQPAAAGSAALWESAVPPTGMFPVARPAAQPPTPPAPAKTPSAPARTPAAANAPVPAKAAESANAPVPAKAAESAQAPVPALAQDQAVAPPRTAGQDQPGATDQQAPETEASGQDLQPAADSRPVTDLQATKSPATAQQAAEDTAKAAPDTAQPAAAPIPASATPQ